MRKIELFRWYTGIRTQEQPIFPGIYNVNDKALYGLADYLVENGHARYLDDPTPIEENGSAILDHDDIPVPKPKSKTGKPRGRPRKS
jgi:hypothetical protein